MFVIESKSSRTGRWVPGVTRYQTRGEAEAMAAMLDEMGNTVRVREVKNRQ